jgi:glycerol kinase
MQVEKKYIIALDQGTTSSRAIIFNHDGKIIGISQKEFNQHFPKPGWVEHDPNEIWSSQLSVLQKVIKKAKISTDEIAGIGITNQRETTMVWDRKTGKPIYNAIVWQDRRTSRFCDQLKSEGHINKVKNRTGLVIDAYFSGTKINWILNNVKGARAAADKGELAFGTVDSWLIWNLTKGKVHVTDVTNASRTMIFNIKNLKWDTGLMKILDIPKSMLPEVKSCSEVYGTIENSLIKGDIPIAGIAGDQQSALFGQMCTTKGMAKNTYGTGCFLVLNTGDQIVKSKNNLLTTIAWQIDGKTTYALEGSVFVAGAAIQWLRDGLGLIKNAADSEKLAKTVQDNGGVYFVPALTGLGAPYWDQYARGTIVGITRGTTKGHIVRAALESIAYQVADVVSAMNSDTKGTLKTLKVDGGAVANDLLLQMQANALNAKVVRPVILETTALGAAYLAGLATGFWSGLKEIKSQWLEDRSFKPAIKTAQRVKEIDAWHRAVERSKGWDTEG